MNRKVLVFSLIALVTTVVQGQNVFIGVKGGLNISNITSDYYSENNGRTGFHLGGLAEFPISDIFSVQTEVLYSNLGAEVFIISLGGGPVKTEYKLDYIQVPVLGKIYPIENLSFEIGPSFNLLINENAERPGLPDIYDDDGNFVRSQTDIEPFGSKFELGGSVGVSYKFKGVFLIGARFTKGISRAFDRPDSKDDAKNNSFQFGIGFIF